ncbi:hypothetical protein R3P38DRAFT_2465996, partial [Favolaschia claudopus]
QPCCGMLIMFPEGRSHHVDYPFGLHQQYPLPWDYYSQRDKFYVQSHHCLRSLRAGGKSCNSCEALLRDDVFVGILQRIAGGIHPSTPLIYRPISVLVETVRNKSDECRGMKLTKLNLVRKL